MQQRLLSLPQMHLRNSKILWEYYVTKLHEICFRLQFCPLFIIGRSVLILASQQGSSVFALGATCAMGVLGSLLSVPGTEATEAVSFSCTIWAPRAGPVSHFEPEEVLWQDFNNDAEFFLS